jgi:hypothetical protein
MRTMSATMIERINAASMSAHRDAEYGSRYPKQVSTTNRILYAIQRKSAPVILATATLAVGGQLIMPTDIPTASASTSNIAL